MNFFCYFSDLVYQLNNMKDEQSYKIRKEMSQQSFCAL